MFYITAHTITQNQFANTFNEWQLTNSDVFSMGIGTPATFGLASATTAITRINNNSPIVLIPNNLHINRNTIKSPEKSGDLHEIVIDDGLRSQSSSVCSTKSLLRNAAVGPDWGAGTIIVISMAVIFALLLFSLIILVFIRIIN